MCFISQLIFHNDQTSGICMDVVTQNIPECWHTIIISFKIIFLFNCLFYLLDAYATECDNYNYQCKQIPLKTLFQTVFFNTFTFLCVYSI